MAIPSHDIQTAALPRRHEDGGGQDQNPPEIGLAELRALVVRRWRTIVACAVLAGLAAALVLAFLVPTLYVADARLLISPLPQSPGNGASGGLYRALATSDGVVERAVAKLVAEGVLDESTVLQVGTDLDAQMTPARGEAAAGSPVFLSLRARHQDPQIAAAIVNTWADAVVEKGEELFRGTAAGSERLIESQLEPTNAEIEQAGDELAGLLDELGQREESTAIEWDRQISAAKKRGQQALAAYNNATRMLMDEAVSRLLPAEQAADRELLSQLQELVSVRSHLARTPRVLTLERAVSADTLSEMLAEGRAAQWLDRTVASEEINPLHEQLALEALRLERALEGSTGRESSGVGQLLVELERIQLERSAGLTALEEENRSNLRVLQLRRGREMEEIHFARLQAREQHARRLVQLGGLAEELSGQLNRSVVARVLDDVEIVKLAVPAAPPRVPVSRQAVIKVGVAIFLGGLLGLMIALFRSAGSPG